MDAVVVFNTGGSMHPEVKYNIVEKLEKGFLHNMSPLSQMKIKNRGQGG